MDPKRTPQVDSWLGPLKKPKPESCLASGGKKTQSGTGPQQTGWTGLRQGEGEGQGDSTGSLQSRPEKFHTRGGRGAKPWAGTLSSLEAKARALKAEAQDRDGAGGRRCTETMSDRPLGDRKPWSPSAPPSQRCIPDPTLTLATSLALRFPTHREAALPASSSPTEVKACRRPGEGRKCSRKPESS